jgi:hypothetical protein
LVGWLSSHFWKQRLHCFTSISMAIIRKINTTKDIITIVFVSIQ